MSDRLIGEMLQAMDFASSQYSTDTEARLQAAAGFALHLICNESTDRGEAERLAKMFQEAVLASYREILRSGHVPWSYVRAH